MRAGPKSRRHAFTENYVQDFIYRGNGSKARISEANCSVADTTTTVLCLFFKSEAGAGGTGTAHKEGCPERPRSGPWELCDRGRTYWQVREQMISLIRTDNGGGTRKPMLEEMNNSPGWDSAETYAQVKLEERSVDNA